MRLSRGSKKCRTSYVDAPKERTERDREKKEEQEYDVDSKKAALSISATSSDDTL